MWIERSSLHCGALEIRNNFSSSLKGPQGNDDRMEKEEFICSLFRMDYAPFQSNFIHRGNSGGSHAYMGLNRGMEEFWTEFMS